MTSPPGHDRHHAASSSRCTDSSITSMQTLSELGEVLWRLLD